MGEKVPFIVGHGAMRSVFAALGRVAPLDTTVLLHGESGTGKELAARFLHENHPLRSRGPFVCVHCGAIPFNLLESELFGHRRGAFTGADRDHVGKFEQAHGGTLFLDEISTMSNEAQIRLLRVLQERQVTPLGSSAARPVDVRIVAATNQDLGRLAASAEFRLDLYYRLSTFPVGLVPLRERLCDLSLLVEHLAAQIARRLGLSRPRDVDPAIYPLLAAQAWPGNVRELENVIEYATVQSTGRERIEVADLPESIRGESPDAVLPASTLLTDAGISFRTAITNLERQLILQSLHLAKGNKARAAELLELKRTTFLEKLRRLEQEELFGDQPDRSSAELAPRGMA